MDQPGIEWCYIGASTAFVAFEDGRRRRFLVNGIPREQDRTMNVAGETIILKPATKTQTLRAQRARFAGKKHVDGNRNGSKSRGRSLAAQLRNAS